jgi:hypothetical protein
VRRGACQELAKRVNAIFPAHLWIAHMPDNTVARINVSLNKEEHKLLLLLQAKLQEKEQKHVPFAKIFKRALCELALQHANPQF